MAKFGSFIPTFDNTYLVLDTIRLLVLEQTPTFLMFSHFIDVQTLGSSKIRILFQHIRV